MAFRYMANETANIRKERIERLLRELEYECARGVMEGEIEEHLGFRFVAGPSKSIPGGVVLAEFRMRPRPGFESIGWMDDYRPGLRVVK